MFARFRPVVTRLEDRTAPAVVVVNSTDGALHYADTVTIPELNPAVTSVTLRDAINAANNTAGPDEIELQAGAVYTFSQTDNFWYGHNALPAITSEIAIDGNGATLLRDASLPTTAAGSLRFFFVSGGLAGQSAGTLTLTRMTLENGLEHGGDAGFGGGGMGAGGAIFNQGELVIGSVTFVGNSAQGG